MKMAFRRRPGPILFVASIGNSNSAFLEGETAPIVEFASAATTIPLDLDLWHRRLAHHHLADVKSLLHRNLVTGMAIDSKAAPDPVCEPCLAGNTASISQCSMTKHCKKKYKKEILFYLQFCLTKKTNIIQHHICHFFCQDMI